RSFRPRHPAPAGSHSVRASDPLRVAPAIRSRSSLYPFAVVPSKVVHKARSGKPRLTTLGQGPTLGATENGTRLMSLPVHHMISAGPRPVAPFSRAVEADGWVFVTGQMPTDPAAPDGPLPEGIEAQTRQVMANLKTVL